MYDDIGKKIKILSKVLGILSAIGAIIITIEQEWSALFGITLAATFFLDSWFGYGFGQLVDDIHLIARKRNAAKNRRCLRHYGRLYRSRQRRFRVML